MIPPTGVRSGYFFPPGRSGRGALPFQSRLAQAGQVFHPQGLPPLRWFLNLNSPENLRQAEALGLHL